jgi:type I restriction-modification system DNA methylase subunit
MPSAFETAFSKVQELVTTFRDNESFYQSAEFSEAQARKDFIDKFFIALGWDVNHETQKNPYEQEVKVERNESGSQRRADYAFFLLPNFRDVRFFVEAKKPHGEFGSPDNYFQTIRYGWGNQTPFAVLTNFDELHILDCRYEPNIGDTLSRVIKKFAFADYANSEKFAEIYWLFSREAVANHSLQKYAETLSPPKSRTFRTELFKRADQPPDESFLIKLDGYREILAKAFKVKNPNLNGVQLTEITQRTLDRLVFIRFLEDKLIEPRRRVAQFGADNKNVWEDFVTASHGLDRIYNGIVFKQHDILDAPGFQLEEKSFRRICEDISDPTSPYNFDSIPIHILGSIYEGFLGKIINDDADVEQKPEVRKAGGVYYTPAYIVRYIVANTVGKLIEGKQPAAIAEMRFADIACGSGSFLLEVFDLLLRYHTKFYNENPGKAKKGDCIKRDDVVHLSLKKKQEILQNNIFGVDVDRQAVEVAQLSLYLKLLEDETLASAHAFQTEFHYTLLPSLNNNIICGNSLVGTDVSQTCKFTPEAEKKLNPMDYEARFSEIMKRGGFDAVVGNPPYIDSEWMTQFLPEERGYCSGRYKAASGNWDIFCVFIEKAHLVTRPGGFVSLIVPNKLGSAGYARGAREVITINNSLLLIRDYSHVRVFPVAVYPIVFVSQRVKPAKTLQVNYERMKQSGKEILFDQKNELKYGDYFLTPALPWQIFASISKTSIAPKLIDRFPKLESCASVLGAATVSEAYEIAELIQDGGRGLKLANSGTIDRFHFLWGERDCRYLGDKYLRPIIPTNRFGNLPHKRLEQAQTPKIIIAGMTLRLECVLDMAGEYLAGKSTSVIFPRLDLRYMLGLLNSKTVHYLYSTVFGGNKLQGGYLRVGPPQLREIPIPVPNLADASEKSRHDLMISLVDEILDAKLKLAAAKSDADKDFYTTKCTTLDDRIDELVYELYGLTEDERAIVASAK